MEIKGTRIFVTGGTGHTGSHLVKMLLEQGAKLCVLTRNPSNAENLSKGEIEIIKGCVEDIDSYRNPLGTCKAMVHIAHIKLAVPVIQACREAALNRLIIISSTRKYTKFPDIISQRVWDGEKEIMESKLNWTILRPSMIYGDHRDKNLAGLLDKIKQLPIMPLPGGGKTLMQPIFVEDICSAIIESLKNDDSIQQDFDLAGPEKISLREAILIMAKAIEKKPFLLPLPLGPVYIIAKCIDLLRRQKEAGLAPRIQRLQENKIYDISKAQKTINFSPHTFEEGIAAKIKSLKNNVKMLMVK